MKFVFLGGCSWLFATAQMYLYTQVLSIHYGLAYAFTQLIIVLINYTLARRWIFRSVTENYFMQGGKFIMTVAVFRVIDWCLFMFFHGVLGIRYYIAIFLALVVVFPIKFITMKIRVFNDKED